MKPSVVLTGLIIMNSLAHAGKALYAKNSKLLKTSSIHAHNSTRDTEELLEWVVEFMKSFVNGPDFDFQGFRRMGGIVSTQISNARHFMERILPPHSQYLKQLEFAAKMYGVMELVTHYMHFYIADTFDQQVLRYILQLSVRLLTLYSLDGVPKSSMPGYVEMVKHYRKILFHWITVFDSLMNVPTSVSLVFEEQSQHALNTINELTLAAKAAQLCNFTNCSHFDKPGENGSKQY